MMYFFNFHNDFQEIKIPQNAFDFKRMIITR